MTVLPFHYSPLISITSSSVTSQGILIISKALQQFEEGDSVNIVIDSSIHKGMPHIRFQGHTGKVEGKQGESYLVGINDGTKHKTLIIRSEYLRRVQ